MSDAEMFDLVRSLAEAKGRQSVDEAVALMHSDMRLETPAFGTVAQGLAQNKAALSGFFGLFPDYSVQLESHASNIESLVAWGNAHMTLDGRRIGVPTNGKRTRLPVFIQFGFRDRLISYERFFFDLSTLAAQSGVSADSLRKVFFKESP